MEDVVSFKKKISSYVKRAEQGNVCLTSFLDEAEISVVKEMTKYASVNVTFSGGIVNSSRLRCLLSFYDYDESSYKIVIYQIIYNKRFYEMNHRAVLGSLMSLGIKRETIGDIVIKENKDTFFACSEEISPYIEEEFKSVGKASISLKKCEFPVENELRYEDKIYFLSSLRLDVAVCAVFSFSRAEVLDVLEEGCVFVNQMMNQNPSHILSEGNMVSVRHKGKFLVRHIGGNSKSGRYIVTLSKLI